MTAGGQRSASVRTAALLGIGLLVMGSTGALADEAPHPVAPAHAAAQAAASSTPSAQSATTAAPRPAHPLDLSAPPISHVLTREQVQAATAEHDDAEPDEDVLVESPHYAAPVPQGQLRALSWALLHPLEAWRIFAPIPDR